MSTDISIQLLGTPEIRVADEVVTFRLAKEYALLYYLATTGSTHTRSALADMFWPDANPKTGRKYLRNHLVELRRYFREQMVITTDSLGINEKARASVDVYHLMSLLAYKMSSGDMSEGANDHTVHHERIAQHRQIIGLYRGDFLKGFSLPDTPLFNDWLDETREDIRLHTANLFYHLSQAEIALGNLIQARDDLEQVLRLIPWNEEAHQLKMRLLYEDGHRWAALEQYAKLEVVLQEELDVEPSVETERLVAQIRADEQRATDAYPQAESTTVATPHVYTGSHPSAASSTAYESPAQPLSCPAPLVPLTGHQALLATAINYLQDPDHRLMTLVGMGGVGKSHIALTLGQMLLEENARHHFPDGVGFVPLVGVEAIEQVAEPQVAGEQIPSELVSQETQRFLSAIAKTLRLSVGSSADVFTQIISYLKQRHLLLILDNFEHVLGARQLLTELVRQVTTCTFLVTSRVRLQLLGETIISVNPLPVAGMSKPDRRVTELLESTPRHVLTDGQKTTPRQLLESLPQSDSYASIRLFLDYAHRCNTGLTIGANDLTAISQLCHLTGGLPLVLGMMAAWTDHFSLPQIVRQLEKDSRLFVRDVLADTATAHQLLDSGGDYYTLDAFFDQSWHLLSNNEQRTCTTLANFVASFDLDAAQEIVGVNMLTLKRLADTSLLQVKQVGRYEFHPLIRAYLQGKWEAVVANDWAHEQCFWERYCTYFLQIVATYAPLLNGENAKDALVSLRHEQDHIHLAWRQAIAHNFVLLIQSTFEHLVGFYNRCRFFNETFALCDRIRQLCTQQPANIAYQHLLTSVNVATIETCAASAQFAEALALAEVLKKQIASQAIPISPELEMRFHLAYTYAMQGSSSMAQEIAQLTNTYNKLAGQISPSLSGNYHKFFFRKAFLEGDNKIALAYAEKALANFQQSGNLWESIRVLQLSAHALNPEQKRARLEQALSDSRRLNHMEMEAQCISSLSSLFGLSQHTQRLKYHEDAISLFQSVGSPADTYGPMLELIAEYIRLGVYTKAETLHRQLIARPYVDEEAYYLTTLQGAMLAFYRGEIETALRITEEIVEQQSRVGGVVQLLGMFYHGYVLLFHGELTEAQTTFTQLQQLLALIEDAFAFEKRFVNMAVAEAAYCRGELDNALVEVERLLPDLAPGLDHGCYMGDIALFDYFRQHWICYQVLDALGDARADDVLQNSYDYLQAWADGIEDVALRRSFLENVAVNRRIVEAVEWLKG